VAALAPSVLGAIRDATGSFDTGMWLVVALAPATTVAAATLSPSTAR
jgi:cyanate permease